MSRMAESAHRENTLSAIAGQKQRDREADWDIGRQMERKDAEIQRLRAALIQIRDVCDDNSPAPCNKEMALLFVRDVARRAVT